MNLRGFILWDIEQAREVRWIEVQHDNQMPPADFGCEWIEIAGPANTTTLAVIDGEWVEIVRQLLPSTELDLARTAKWDEAKAYRAARVFGGCATPFGRVQTDEASQTNIMGAMIMAQAAMAAGAPFEQSWRMEDNSLVPLDAGQMVALAMTVGLFKSACFAASFAIADAIDAAETIEDLAAINVTAGFPS